MKKKMKGRNSNTQLIVRQKLIVILKQNPFENFTSSF